MPRQAAQSPLPTAPKDFVTALAEIHELSRAPAVDFDDQAEQLEKKAGNLWVILQRNDAEPDLGPQDAV